ncbi:MAG: T9SS type A sorting domain-containing protein [Ignavibacteria bacterium]|nr:T9SS type A sorting domain-containing protein [Ignavibacteria bacterium]
MKELILILFLYSSILFGQNPADEIWDVLIEFNVTVLSGSNGNAGAEWNGSSFFSTRYGTHLIHEYSADGTTLIREFSIPGVTGLRDLAWDGTYFYGGNTSNVIFQMDFTTETLVNTISTGSEIVRNIAYDSDQDGFWVGDWTTDIVLFGRDGAELARIPLATHGNNNIYGSCYDNDTPGGPYIWIFRYYSVAEQLIVQLQLPDGTPTGVTHDVMSDVGVGTGSAGAGGLFCMNDFSPGYFTIGGLLQGTPDEIFVYEIGLTTDVSINNNPQIGFPDLRQNYPNPFNLSTRIKYSVLQSSIVVIKIFDILGNEIETLVDEERPVGNYEIEFDGSDLPSGVYFYKLQAVPTGRQADSFVETKKMILMK